MEIAMSAEQALTFKHFDKICNVPAGGVLLVAEPVVGLYKGKLLELAPGTWLRVISKNDSFLRAEFVIDGQVDKITIDSDKYCNLELKP
jgi:hypothetical protein